MICARGKNRRGVTYLPTYWMGGPLPTWENVAVVFVYLPWLIGWVGGLAFPSRWMGRVRGVNHVLSTTFCFVVLPVCLLVCLYVLHTDRHPHHTHDTHTSLTYPSPITKPPPQIDTHVHPTQLYVPPVLPSSSPIPEPLQPPSKKGLAPS